MNMDAGTLVILTPGFPESESDSTCLPSQQLFVGALNKIYPRLKIVVLSFEYPFRKSTYIWKGNQVFSYHGWKKGRLEKIRTCFAVWNRLRKLRRENKVIGLLSFWCTECAWIGKHFARFHHLIHHIWILGQDARKENKWVSRISPQPEELIAMSDFLAGEFFRNHGVRPKYIIPNAIEPDLFKAPPGERDIDLLGVGSLIALKQYDIFIAVAKALSGFMPQLHCVICGMG
ncbi:MAG TPA: hypothetical protein VK543_08720, partial [Puia sp.]|nr:hypothetical protein [Puia sp.]